MSTVVPPPSTVQPKGSAARYVLAGLIDYAGLFPPAELSMPAAVRAYLAARAGEHSWMLGRFLCPASRLDELARQIDRRRRRAERQFQLRVVSDGDPAEDATRALEFAGAMAPTDEELARPRSVTRPPAPSAASFDMFEMRWSGGRLDGLLDAVSELTFTIPVVEVSGHRDPAPAVAALARERRDRGKLILAKIRCGGLTADAFPTPQYVARFVASCAREGLPFKATAGLHQPFRHVDAATGFTRHGFVNLRVASLLGRVRGLGEATLAEIVDDRDPAGFELSDRVLRWRNHEVTAGEIGQIHWQSLVAYGSCDFAEPVEGLHAAGILPLPDPPPPEDHGTGPVY